MQHIDIMEIQPDVSNPRILDFLLDNPNPDKSAVFRMLGEDEPVRAGESRLSWANLKKSIENHGGLINPIIMSKNGSEYKVVEGNTRLGIYIKLHSETKDDKWKEIPAIVHEGLDEDGVKAIRLQAHLVGFRPWTPYAKGRYLHTLNEEAKNQKSELDVDTVIRLCGGKKKDIINYIAAYQDMTEYFIPLHEKDMDIDPTRFSAFVEIQAPRRRQSLNDHGYSMHDFSKWVKERRIVKNEHVRSLKKILDNDEAKEAFLDQNSTEAIRVLDQIQGSLDGVSTVALANELIKRVRTQGFTMNAPGEIGDIGDALEELHAEISELMNVED